jgi:glycosyltransferase involved in cell wall biosynthesis
MKIAVLLPSYNHAGFIGQAIEAIRAQSHADWELAIVDDASTDHSRDVIADYARQDSRIVTRFLPQNGGVMPALKTCYAMTTAPLVVGAAADDVIVNPRHFEAVNTAFTANPQAGCVFAKASLVDQMTGKEYFVMGKAPRAGWIAPRECLRDFLNDRIFIHGAAVAWRRSDVDRAGGYDPELGPRADFFLNLAISALAGAVFVDQVASIVRFSPGAYGQSVDDATHFREFALAERKLMALDLGYRVDPRWRRRWRDNVINERLANRWQKGFFDAVRKPIAAFDRWHLPRLAPGLGEIATQLQANAPEWEKEIDRRVAAAESAFDSVAGPLHESRFDAFRHRLVHPRRRPM